MFAGYGVGVATGPALVVVAGTDIVSVAGSDLGSASTQYLQLFSHAFSRELT